jgi:hypothetical protein
MAQKKKTPTGPAVDNPVDAAVAALSRSRTKGNATPPAASGSEQDPAFQKTMGRIVDNAGQMTEPPASEFLPIDVRRLLDPQLALAGDKRFEEYLESLGSVEGAFKSFQESPEGEARAQAMVARDAEFSGFCYKSGKGRAGKFSHPSCIRDDGFQTPRFNMNAAEQAGARLHLSNAINLTAAQYAAEAGVSQKDMARILGGIATIESSYGTKRSVVGAKYASSAGGAMHYLDGTIAAEVRANMGDRRVAERVAALGINPADGISKSEAWALKNDDLLSTRLVAIGIVNLAKKNPELARSPDALATRYYMQHNLGAGGANALLSRGVSAVGEVAASNNPMFFRGADSSAEVTGRYQRYVVGAMKSADNLTAQLTGASPVLAAKKDAGLPAPSPT